MFQALLRQLSSSTHLTLVDFANLSRFELQVFIIACPFENIFDFAFVCKVLKIVGVTFRGTDSMN